MKVKRKYLLMAVLVILAAAGWYAYREYHRKAADLSSVKPVAGIDAVGLVELYGSDEQKANALYLGKPIDVKGVIAEINNQQDTVVNVLLGNKDAMNRVSCLLDLKYVNDIKRYHPGDTITIRGICTGYLMDVELNRCVIVPDQKSQS